MQLRARLALLFAAATAALVGIGGFAFLEAFGSGLRSGVISGVQARAAAIAQSVASQASPDHGPLPSSPSESFVDQDELAQVVDQAGRVIAASGPQARTSVLSPVEVAAVTTAGQQRRFERVVASFEARMILVAVPVGRTGLVVVAGKTLDTVASAVRRVEWVLVIGGPLVVLAAAAAAWAIAGAALRPVERMRREAEEISDRHSDATLGVPATRDEVAALARTFNELLARLQGALHRQRAFVSAAGHELRTPLSNLQLELELAGRAGRTREELSEAVTAASEEASRLARLAEDLLLLAQSDEGRPLVLPSRQLVSPLLESAAARVHGEARRRQVCVAVASPPGAEAVVDEVRLRQVLDNLLDNALRFAPTGSTVSMIGREERGRVILEVADTGPGFPHEYLPRAFERFSRPDPSRDRDRGGTGLGLAIAWAIVDAHGGTIGATNDAGGGARVTISLPG